MEKITKDTQEGLPFGVITLASSYTKADEAFRSGDLKTAAAWGRVWLLILGGEDPEDEDGAIRDAVYGTDEEVFEAMYG